MLGELSQHRAAFEKEGVQICLVHLDDEARASDVVGRYGLADLPRVSDPDGALYEWAEVQRGGVASFLNPSTFLRGLKLALRGVLPGRPKGDVFRLSGVTLVDNDEVRSSFLPEIVSEPVPWDTLLASVSVFP